MNSKVSGCAVTVSTALTIARLHDDRTQRVDRDQVVVAGLPENLSSVRQPVEPVATGDVVPPRANPRQREDIVPGNATNRTHDRNGDDDVRVVVGIYAEVDAGLFEQWLR